MKRFITILLTVSLVCFFTLNIQYSFGKISDIKFINQDKILGAGEEWLSDWNNRIKITVSNTNIDSDLTNFPLLLTLGSSVGTGSDDVTAIFDELTSDDNRKKIAVTKSDGETECYVEIEEWDDANEKAILWVSKSDLVLSSTAVTDLYIYYDSEQSDNTTYVADIGSRTEVWDSNYKMVQHSVDNTTSSITDSTSNNLDGTKEAASNPVEATAKISTGQDYTDDHISCGDMGIGTTFTTESWVKPDTLVGTGDNSTYGYTIMATDSGYGTWLTLHGTEVRFWAYETTPGVGGYRETADAGLSVDNWYHIVTYATKSGTSKVFVNGIEELSFTNDGDTNWSTGFTLGDLRPARNINFDGIIDEVRISDNIRSDAWIKSAYYSGDDNLVSYGSSESGRISKILKVSGGKLKISGKIFKIR